MRIGTNPAKAGLPAYEPKKLGIALIVYIPILEGYFQNSLEIFKTQIASIRASTPAEYDLLVFNNGCCQPVVTELHSLYRDKQIDWLIQSQNNLGKAGAWNWIFACMPNELICYADSDVLFRPGWLEASLEILEAFPQAGMIAAQSNFFDVLNGEGQAHLAHIADGIYTLGEYWPPKEIIDEYCLGIGAASETADQFYRKPLPLLTNPANNRKAVLGASHMQFLIPRQVARQVVPLPAAHALLRRETTSLDRKIDERGFLHLSTLQPYVFHMGNRFEKSWLNGLQSISITAALAKDNEKQEKTFKSRTKRWLVRLAQKQRINEFLRKVYHLLFQVINSED